LVPCERGSAIGREQRDGGLDGLGWQSGFDPSAPIMQLLETSDLQDTYETANFRCRKNFGTYATFFPQNVAGATRIDAIFYRGDVSVDWVCADELIKYGVYISDHLPYHAVFKIPIAP
jgi:endonuclease/exonuclease/phosphatase family metal-dependent hydrolase